MFLGVPRHYARMPYSCWCTVCSCVRGRGHGSNSCGPNLMVQGCTRTKQNFWTEHESTVTSSPGIRNRDVRVAEIVVREKRPNLTSGDTCRIAIFGHLRRRGRCVLDTSGCWSSARFLEATAACRKSSSWAPASTRSTRGCALATVTALSWLVCDCIEWMKIPQLWPLRNGTRQQILMLRRLRWQWSSTRQSCEPPVSTSEKWYHCNSWRRCVEDNVRAARSSSRFTAWVPGGMYFPWIMTMSSGHDVSEYELDASGLPRVSVSPQ